MTISILIIGLGYVGLPLLVSLSKHYNVYGYDVDKKRIEDLKRNNDNNNEINKSDLKKISKNLYSDLNELNKNINTYIITVPTPIDKKYNPNLKFLINATNIVANNLKKNDLVVYESTVYPGTTEEICIPILEKNSKLKFNKDFTVGYSPERINPGDKINNLKNVIKIISASNKKALKMMNNIYSKILINKPFITESIRIAEAAKVIENAQRDINIAFMNELSQIFSVLNIDTNKVLEAASTKWNFNRYYPGLVGGHCIGVDPYYLAYKSKINGYSPKFLLQGREINNSMPKFILNKILDNINIKVSKIKCLVLGISFKEDVNDIRNSKVIDLCKLIKKKRINFDVFDPLLSNSDRLKLSRMFNFIDYIKFKKYNLVILAVNHSKFNKINFKKFKKNATIFQVKNHIRKKLDNKIINL